jgi:hypothetical protein
VLQFKVVKVLDSLVFLRNTKFVHRITHCSIPSDFHLDGRRCVSVEVGHVLIERDIGAEIRAVGGIKPEGFMLTALGH